MSPASRDKPGARAWPPLIREMCLRTQLISWMLAPQSSNNCVVFCFSASVMGGAGSGSKAEAPPEIKQMTRSSGPALARDLRDAPRAGHAALVGHGMPAFVDLDAPQLRAVAVFDVDLAAVDSRAQQSFDRASHLRAGFTRADHEDIAVRLQGRPADGAARPGIRIGGFAVLL